MYPHQVSSAGQVILSSKVFVGKSRSIRKLRDQHFFLCPIFSMLPSILHNFIVVSRFFLFYSSCRNAVDYNKVEYSGSKMKKEMDIILGYQQNGNLPNKSSCFEYKNKKNFRLKTKMLLRTSKTHYII